MKKFKFRLQSVLNAREKAFEDAQLALAKVQAKLNRQIKHLESLHQKLNHTKKDLESLLTEGTNIDLSRIKNYQDFMAKLKEDIKNQHKIIADTKIEMEEKKQELIEAMKAKRMLEKLKEKDLKEFNASVERMDLKEIDEIATNRHKRA